MARLKLESIYTVLKRIKDFEWATPIADNIRKRISADVDPLTECQLMRRRQREK